jgi:thioredoxin-like negative regulator of GroEL
VRGMTPGHEDWERRVAGLWASIDGLPEDEFLAAMDQLVSELGPDDPTATFERASALDSTGHSDQAAPLYRRAIDQGLEGTRRRRAVIQMASSLRNLGQAEESVSLLRAEREAGSDELDDAVTAFLALALVDTGHEREAISLALTALSGHMTRYRRSLAAYAGELL